MNKSVFIGLAAAVMTACNPSTQHQEAMTAQEKKAGVVEITTFQLHQGVAEKDFELSALAMQKGFLEQQSGFIKRTLTVSQDSVWTDVVYWQDRESAEKAMQLTENEELVLPFMEKIDFHSVSMRLTKPILIAE